MLFVRLYLDDVDESSGAMVFMVDESVSEVLDENEIGQKVMACESKVEVAKAGDALVLNMLTPHASLSSESRQRRRVLRIDYANERLPYPLEWAYLQKA